MRRGFKFMRIVLGLLLGLVISIAAALYVIDFNEYRDVLSEQLSEAMGRPLHIAGDIKLRLGLHTGFSASDLTIDTGRDDGAGSRAKVGRISFGLSLLPLLRQEVEIDQLQIEDADVLLDRLPNGQFDWIFGHFLTQGEATAFWATPRIADFRLQRGNVTYRDGDAEIALAVSEYKLHAANPAAAADIVLAASIRGQPISFVGRLESLDALMQGREIQIGGTLEVAAATAIVKGRIFKPLEAHGIDLHVAAKTDQVQSLQQVAGLEPILHGQANISFDLNDRDGLLAARNIVARITPEPGLQITITGGIADALALAGSALDVEIQAADGAQLFALAGLDLPAISPVRMRGQVAGALANPTLKDLALEAGTKDGLRLSATGSVAMPLTAQGLDLKIRLQGPDSAMLSSYAGAAVPALGRFDVSARLMGDGQAPSLSRINGSIHHAGGTEIELRGAVENPLAGDGLALEIRARGPSLAGFAALSGNTIPDPGKFQVSAQLTGGLQAPLIDRLQLQSQSRQGVTLILTGRISQPLTGQGLDLQFDLTGPVAAVWEDFSDLPVPSTIPSSEILTAAGKIRGSMAAFQLQALDVRLGGSDIAGDMNVDLRGDRPLLNADLHSKYLNLDFLPTQPEAPEPQSEDRLIPDMAIDPGALALFDGELKYRAQQLRRADLVLQQLQFTLVSRHGALILKSSTARLAKGQLIVDGSLNQGNLAVRLTLRRAAMSDLGALLDSTMIEGSLDLTADLRGRLTSGHSDLRALAASLNGETSVIITDGYMQSRFLDLLAEDLVLALVKEKAADNQTRLHCLASSHGIKDGVAKSRMLLLDTEKITVVGDGQTDLGSEAIRYRLTPRPKDPSLVSLATPIDVSGTLADPSAVPDSMAVAGSVAVAVVGNLLLPGVGLLLPLLSAGTGEAHPCMDVLKGGKLEAAPATPAGKQSPAGILGRVGGAVGKGAGALLKLPGKLLRSE